MQLTDQQIEVMSTYSLSLLNELIPLLKQRVEEAPFDDYTCLLTWQIFGEAMLDVLDGNDPTAHCVPGLVAETVAQAILMRMDRKHRRAMEKSRAQFAGKFGAMLRKLAA